MKKAILTIYLSLLASVSQAALTFNEIILKKDLKNSSGIHFTAHTSVSAWCGKYGNAVDVGSFKAAQAIEALEDGLYKCSGEFAKLLGKPVTLFKIDNCTAVDADELRVNCQKN